MRYGTFPSVMTELQPPAERIAELEQRVRELSCLLEVSRQVNAEWQLDKVLDTVLSQAISVIEAEAGTLWIVEKAEHLIVPRVVAGPATSAITHIRLHEDEGIVGRVIQTRTAEMIQDAERDERWAGRVDQETGFRTRSIMCAPLIGREGAVGCLQLLNKLDGRLFEPSDLELLTALASQAALVIENSRLLEETLALARSLSQAWTGTLDALTAALATRDNDTQDHCYRTVELSVLLARRMGVDELEIPAIARGALLHDIGKIGISDSILLKPGSLTPAEYSEMQRHVELGHEMLRHIPAFRDALPIVLYHHEHMDGSGYPHGLAGAEIPLGACIFHVVDVYDALTHERPYKMAWSHEDALVELNKYAGSRYDPDVVNLLGNVSLTDIAGILALEGFSPETRNLLGRHLTN